MGKGGEHSLGQDFGVRYASAAVIGGHPLAGSRAPHAWVSVDGCSVSTLDLFGDHLTVLTGAYADPGPAAPHVRHLRLGVDFGDPDGDFAAAYALGPGDAVLVRPDGYVAWGGPVAGITPAIAELTEGIRRTLTGRPGRVGRLDLEGAEPFLYLVHETFQSE